MKLLVAMPALRQALSSVLPVAFLVLRAGLVGGGLVRVTLLVCQCVPLVHDD